jgi:ribosomal protein L32
MKLTHSKTASRRAHHRTGTPRLVVTASGARRRHFMDPATGMYRGKQIITIGSAAVVVKKKVSRKPAKAAAPKKDTAAEAASGPESKSD